MSSFPAQRRNMVDCQLRTFDVFDRAILAAMAEVPRERFVPPDLAALAYRDQNLVLSIGNERRVMLAPMVLGRMIQALAIETRSRVLDVGSGFGYSAAVFARLGAEVTAFESDGEPVRELRSHLAETGIGPVGVAAGPLEKGAPGGGTFDAILINGAVEDKPDALIGQLADGGRLACLAVDDGSARAVIFVRSGQAVGSRRLFDASAPVLDAFRRAPAFVF